MLIVHPDGGVYAIALKLTVKINCYLSINSRVTVLKNCFLWQISCNPLHGDKRYHGYLRGQCWVICFSRPVTARVSVLVLLFAVSGVQVVIRQHLLFLRWGRGNTSTISVM